MLDKLDFYYFSPTGGTKKVGEVLVNEMCKAINCFNLGKNDDLTGKSSCHFAVIAVPVFSGRIPTFVVDKLNQIDACGNKAVTLVVYGNRAYDDALLELNDIVMNIGFNVIASGAFVAQHSMDADVATGRPDKKDIAEIQAFAQEILKKIEHNENNVVVVPGHRPYKNVSSLSVTPISLPSCQKCGRCIHTCPCSAIQMINNTIETDSTKCILCMACVHDCPSGDRILPPPLQENMKKMLSPFVNIHHDNEKFI